MAVTVRLVVVLKGWHARLTFRIQIHLCVLTTLVHMRNQKLLDLYTQIKREPLKVVEPFVGEVEDGNCKVDLSNAPRPSPVLWQISLPEASLCLCDGKAWWDGRHVRAGTWDGRLISGFYVVRQMLRFFLVCRQRDFCREIAGLHCQLPWAFKTCSRAARSLIVKLDGVEKGRPATFWPFAVVTCTP